MVQCLINTVKKNCTMAIINVKSKCGLIFKILFISFLIYCFIHVLHNIFRHNIGHQTFQYENIFYSKRVAQFDSLPAVYDDDRPIMKVAPLDDRISIPSILHFQWKTHTFPDFTAKYLSSWRKNHQNWTIMLWTDEEMEKFAIKFFSKEFLTFYTSFSQVIYKVDIFRYAIMYHFGGIYADIDVEVITSLESLRNRHSCIVPREPEPYFVSLGYDRAFLASNFLLGSRPGHPFWIHLISQIRRELGDTSPSFWSGILGRNAIDFTGPLAITRGLESYVKRHTDVIRHDAVFLAPSIYFYQRDLTDKGDTIHLEMLNWACGFIRWSSSSAFKTKICDTLWNEKRIDWTAMYSQPRHFNNNGSSPFTKHLQFNSWNGSQKPAHGSTKLVDLIGPYKSYSKIENSNILNNQIASAFDREQNVLVNGG